MFAPALLEESAPSMTQATSVSHAEFSRRFKSACDQHQEVPGMNLGRLRWLRDNLKSRYELDVSTETIRKWYHGEAYPRVAKMRALAALLQVDEAWLAVGADPEMNERERRVRDATADGAVNVVAGFIRMNGGRPAFPTEDDNFANTHRVDIYAIIRGAQFRFHVALADEQGEGVYRFSVPKTFEDISIIGVIHVEPLQCAFVEISSDLIRKHGAIKADHFEVTVTRRGDKFSAGADEVFEIRSFDTRATHFGA